ncbi:Alpha/Beta hydrolase protein [Podospora appendiculata]|uniref:Kynurenine formamidase n=1 Tax=Podospora appendiculata TaxID=314037 RepID=A0AAE0X2G7_9PEZI|nr:Alpha/Beta hydrolase protein [Podospora appendiculata]
MSSPDWAAWASIPWTPLTASPDTTTITDTNNKTIGYHKHHVPYLPQSTPSPWQTLDVWIPPPSTGSPPPRNLIPSSANRPWLIFIHGGAWRDPFVTSSAFSSAALHILSSPTGPQIAGLASLNYRLSPYPSHPTSPSPPSKPGATPDPARLARHPDHIHDVLAGIGYLQRLGAASGPYVLAGHSCGATMAFQAAMDPSRWGLSPAICIAQPAALVGLNGLYDLAGFIASPPAKYAGLRDAYAEFTCAAFGDDETAWRAACPATADGWWPREWDAGRERRRRVVLVQSCEDSLVPRQQLESMRGYLEREEGVVEVLEMEALGEHDGIWVSGERMAQILLEVAAGLGQA